LLTTLETLKHEWNSLNGPKQSNGNTVVQEFQQDVAQKVAHIETIRNRLANHLVHNRPTNRLSNHRTNNHLSRNPKEMEEQLMTNWISATEEERQLMDKARKAGVRRGINASRNVLLNMIAAGEGMTAAAALKMALEQLTNLTIEEVEG